MSVSPKTKREKLAEREDAIISAATAAFLQNGMRAAKMADIARDADVAEGTIYLYFKNKEALFTAVVARHWVSLTRGAKAEVTKHQEPLAQLEALGRFTLERILYDWKLFELSFFMAYGSDEEKDASDRRGYVQIFDRVIEKGVDRGEFRPTVPIRRLRDLFFGTMEYAVRSMLLQRQEGDVDETLAMLMAAVTGVLQPLGPQPQQDLADRLEAAVDRLEFLTKRASDT